MPLGARLEQRTLVLTADDAQRLVIPLDQGGRHRIVAPDAASVGEIVAALETCPGVGVLPANGGLLGTLTVAENFALALRYGADPQDDAADDWQHALQLTLEVCGLPPERIRSIARERPIGLERGERWLLGFVRNLLRPPELLVLDRVFGGLSRRQADALIALEAVYHDVHPFRPTLFVDVDAHELPAVPDCMNHLELETLPLMAASTIQ
jgi:ABC-type transporter Mla maintaining outer membrane lipid asymmetry ATPase subunit MlaF